MNLLFPVFLSAAALVGLPLLLHVLKLQPRKLIPFPSLRFLGAQALKDSNRHRLRRWLLLLLRCLFILLIVLAFCRPYWPFAHTEKSHSVIVAIDNSYSMQAEGRLAAIDAWLAPQIAALRPPDQLGVILLHPTPTWLVPLTNDLEAGRSALKTLPRGYETSHYRPGLDLASAKLALSTHEEKIILLASDEQLVGWNGARFDQPLAPGVTLLVAPTAPPPHRQAALTELKVARTADGRLVFDATVRGFSTTFDERTVTFFANGVKLGTQQCVLTGYRAQSVQAILPAPNLAAAQALHASIDADDLPTDDTAYAALPALEDNHVLLAPVSPLDATDFLERAFASISSAALRTFQREPLPTSGAWSPGAVAVLRGANPFAKPRDIALDEFLAAGGSAWIICNGSPEQAAWLLRHGVTVAAARIPVGEKLKLRDLTLEHPLYAPFAGASIAPLLTPIFTRAWTLEGEALEPLARWPDHSVAIAELPTGAGRLLLTGFGETRADSTFPLEAGYVPFVHQAICWLAQNPRIAPLSGRVGTTLSLPGNGTWRPMLSPQTTPALSVNGFVTPTAPGHYIFEQEGIKRTYAINLDTAESDLTAWPTPNDFTRLNNPAPAKAAAIASQPNQPVADEKLVDERQVWWWLLAAAVVVLLLELLLSNRTLP